MYNEFKDIFEGYKQGFYRKSRPLTYWHRIWRTCGRQSSLANRRETQCVSKLSPGGKKLIRWPAVNILSWGLLIFLFCIFFLFFFCLFAHFALFWSPDGKKASSHTNFTGLGSTADRCSADLFHRRTKSQLIVGLPRFYVHSKVDFRGKSKVLRVIIKPKWNVLPTKKKHIPRQRPWTQSSAKWDALTNVLLSQFALLFWSYRSTLLQCSLCKILLPSKYITSLGNWFNAFCCCPEK